MRRLWEGLSRFLTRPTEAPAWGLLRWCLVAWPLMFLPSLLLAALARGLAHWMGVDTAVHSAPDVDPLSVMEWVGMLLLAPVLETALLMLGLQALKALGLQASMAVLVSALLWGVLHGAWGALWFFGTVWPFWVVGWAVEGWLPAGKGKAFVAAALPHALQNGSVMLLVLLLSV